MNEKEIKEELENAMNALQSDKEISFMFAFEKKEGIEIRVNATDEFMYDIVTQILLRHREVMIKVVGDLLESAVEMMIFDKMGHEEKH